MATSLTVQALDGVYGRSAVGVVVRLAQRAGGDWLTFVEATTDGEGRIDDWGVPRLDRGQYRISLDTDRYFAGLGINGAYPEVVVAFRIADSSAAHCIQITLASNSLASCFWEG